MLGYGTVPVWYRTVRYSLSLKVFCMENKIEKKKASFFVVKRKNYGTVPYATVPVPGTCFFLLIFW